MSDTARIERCPICEYDLAGMTPGLCPECGCDVPAEFARRRPAKPITWILVPLWLGAIGWGVGSYLLIAFSAAYGSGPFSADPLPLGIHTMTLLAGTGSIASTLFQRRLRRARPGAYWSAYFGAMAQLVLCAGVWLWALGH